MTRIKRHIMLLGAIGCALSVAACSSAVPRTQAPVPAAKPTASKPMPKIAPKPIPKNTPAPTPVVLAGPWIDWPITPGNWSYRTDDRGSIALFGVGGRDALITVRCDAKARRIYLSRAQQFVHKTPAQLKLRASDGLHSWPARSSGGAPPYLAVEIAPGDPALDMLAFSRGRFAIEVDGESSLAIPAWAEPARVIEDCRGG